MATSLLVQPAVAQRLTYATHDWPNLTTNNGGRPTVDAWMDVKQPGNGVTYSVGTTQVNDTSNAPSSPYQFSGFVVRGEPGVLSFSGTGAARQVAVVQAADAGGIVWQKYFYGQSPNQGLQGLSTHARAVAVYPAALDDDVRVVVCGDTYDQRLPLAVTDLNTNFSNTSASGWIAVYDGGGDLLWCYQFFGDDPGASTMVTDVSIRVREGRDEITYCGVSTNGAYLPAGNAISTMQPKNWFAAPPASASCGETPAGGDSHHGTAPTTRNNQWDGFVGRLSMPHAGPYVGPANTVLDFHSIVGGHFQDGLFGLAEVDHDNFVVVGSTTNYAHTSPSTAWIGSVPMTRQVPFDLTTQICFSPLIGQAQWSSFGTVFWFDASQVRWNPSGPLLLRSSTLLGSSNTNTIARDVAYSGGRIWIVGSTDDPGFTRVDPLPADPTLGGLADGFLCSTTDPALGFDRASFVGGPDVDAITGIAAWNEYPDHLALVGWSRSPTQGRQMRVESWFHDVVGSRLRQLRSVQFGGSEDDQPAHIPSGFAAGWGSPGWIVPAQTANFGGPEGGGITMNARPEVTFVGCTNSQQSATIPGSADFPTVAGSATARGTQALHNTADTDAVRAVVDMLPVGVCRTDGTGACSPSWSPGSPTTPYFGAGGTTPACALLPYGNQLGSPGQLLYRSLIDIESTLGSSSILDTTNGAPMTLTPGQDVAILLDRPPPGSTLQGSVMQVGFPSSNPIQGLPLPPEVEIWVGNSPFGSVSLLYFVSGASIRVSAGVLPVGPITFSIQFLSLLTIPSGATPPCGNPALTWSASPALIFGV